MINTITNPKLRFLQLFSMIGLTIILAIQQVYAKDLDWDEGTYTHYSDQEPLVSLLDALAASQKTPIIMSDKIKATISGYYRKMPPKEIFLKVLKSNGLVWYYDGETLYVEREEEMQTGSVSLTNISATQFTRSLERLGVLDHHYQWVNSDVDKMVYFKGPEPFVTAVLEMSKVLDKKTSRPRIYKWVDANGITNFSSDVPDKYKNNREVQLSGDKDVDVVLE
jgi:type III secretion protein C